MEEKKEFIQIQRAGRLVPRWGRHPSKDEEEEEKVEKDKEKEEEFIGAGKKRGRE